MPRQKPIVVVGSINMDLVSLTDRIPAVGETVLGSDFQLHPGGKGANQAVAVARLGYPVRLIGRLGSDLFGEQLRANLNEVGVDTTGVATSEGSSGVAVIVVSGKGENSIVVTPAANAKVTPQDIEARLDTIREAGLILTQLETPLETLEYLAATCAREGIPMILDPAPAMKLPSSVFETARWITPNETEAAFYTRDELAGSVQDLAAIAQTMLNKGSYGVVLKMGGNGVYIASREGLGEMVPAIAVNAVDTTAAGDAFNGAFATGLMLGKTAVESARFAAIVAGISVTRKGAQPSMPKMAEVNDFIQKNVENRMSVPRA